MLDDIVLDDLALAQCANANAPTFFDMNENRPIAQLSTLNDLMKPSGVGFPQACNMPQTKTPVAHQKQL
jgi:hypothetical protein